MELFLVLLGGVLSGIGGYIAARQAGRSQTEQTKMQIEQEWNRVLDADLRAFQESVIALVETLQTEYVYVAQTGLKELNGWLPLQSYSQLVRCDMWASRNRSLPVESAWRELREDAEGLRRRLQVAVLASNSSIVATYMDDEGRRQTFEEATKELWLGIASLSDVIAKHQAFGKSMQTAYRRFAATIE